MAIALEFIVNDIIEANDFDKGKEIIDKFLIKNDINSTDDKDKIKTKPDDFYSLTKIRCKYNLLQHMINNKFAENRELLPHVENMVEYLIEKGINVNYTYDDDNTTLFDAVHLCSSKIVKLLLDNGAVEVINKEGGADHGGTPLGYAVFFDENDDFPGKSPFSLKYKDIIQTLLDYGADPNTALMQCNHEDVAEMLVPYIHSVEMDDFEEMLNEQCMICKYLIRKIDYSLMEKDVLLMIIDSYNITYDEIKYSLCKLVSLGTLKNMINEEYCGYTITQMTNSLEVFKLLIKFGADVNKEDNIEFHEERENEEIVNYLKEL